MRQQALRKQIGEVGETRRTIEPIFGELKERQGQLEQSLADIETDDNKNSLAGRLKQVSGDVAQIQARLKALMESWETLTRFKEEFGASQTQLVRLQAPDEGLAAMINELHARRDQLTQTLGALETHGEEKLAARVEALARSKLETEQRIASLDDCFAILNTVRQGFWRARGAPGASHAGPCGGGDGFLRQEACRPPDRAERVCGADARSRQGFAGTRRRR